MRYILFTVIIAFIVSSCGSNKYQKTLKNGDASKKMELAEYYYKKKDYYRASTLFEQLMETYSGTSMAEKVTYYSAYCNYGLQNNILAGYQFKTYYENFPTGKWAEECLYMYSYCLFLESQNWYLDQTDTYKALEAIRIFISVYPDSKYISECNQEMDKLRNKLGYKAYRNAKLYYNIGEYTSAIVALQNVIKDYPEIPQKEELDYLTVKSHFLLTNNSVDSKIETRYKAAITSIQQYEIEYPESKYLNELKKLKYKSDSIYKKYMKRMELKKEKEKEEQKS